MPFRVLGPDLMDPQGLSSPGPEFARASLPERANVLRLKDPILDEQASPDGIELPALHEPQSIEMRPSSTPSTIAIVMPSKDFTEAGRRG